MRTGVSRGKRGKSGVVRTGPAPAQLPEESDEHYGWFVDFWREGESVAVRKLAARWKTQTQKASVVRIKMRWDARVAAGEEEKPEVREAWAGRREVLREEEWSLHRECLEAGREALARWRESGEVASMTEIVSLLEFAAKLARLAAGMPDSHMAVSGEDGEPIRVQFEDALRRAYGPVVDVVSDVVVAEHEREEERIENGCGPGCAVR